MKMVRWTVAALALALVASTNIAVAQGGTPTVELLGGIESSLANQDWQHAPATDVPVVLHFDDADLDIDADVTGAGSVSWYWEHTLQGSASSGADIFAGPCESVSPPDDCSSDQPSVIPASDLDATDGWFTYYLTYKATNGAGTTTEHLEIRVIDADQRPLLTVSGHDADAMTLSHPFLLVADGTVTSGNALPLIYRWNDADAQSTLLVDETAFQHGDALPTYKAQAFDENGPLGEVPSEAVVLDLTLDLSPVFALGDLAGAVGDTVTADVTLAYPDAADVTYAYSWTKAADPDDVVLGTDASLSLDDADLDKGDVVTLTVTATNDAVTTATAQRTESVSFTVGNAAPVVDSVAVAPGEPLTSEDLTVTASGSDVDGDAVTLSYEWLRDGTVVPDQTDASLPASATTAGEEWVVRVTANDGSTDSAPVDSDVITILPPAPTVTYDGPDDSDWLTSTDVILDLTVDGELVTVTCSVDGGAFVDCADGEALDVGSDGSHDIVVKATNPSGEDTDSGTVQVDATAPSVSIAVERGPDEDGWYTEPVDFTASGSDATSGLASCDDDETYDGPSGEDVEVTMTCRDEAGNTGTATRVIDFDEDVPTVSFSVGEWTSNSAVTIDVDDAHSGVHSWSAQYRIDGGSWTDLGGSGETRELPTTTEGATIDFRATMEDVAGNVRDYPTEPDATTTIDTTDPAAPTGVTVTPRAGGDFLVKWNAPSDSGAPMDHYVVRYSVDGGSFKTLDSDVSGTQVIADLDADDGVVHAFRVAAVDAANNQGDYSSDVEGIADNGVPAGVLSASSSTHDDDGPSDRVAFSWGGLSPLPGDSITYRYALSQASSLSLGSSAQTTSGTSAEFFDVEPGTWYFHLEAEGLGGVVEASPVRVEVYALLSDAEVAAANKALDVDMTGTSDGVLLSWTIPDAPGTVAGVQVWSIAEDGSLKLLKTLDDGDAAFEAGALEVDDAFGYTVTLFYEHGEGKYALDAAPDSGDYETFLTSEGIQIANTSGSFPWAPVLIAGSIILLMGGATAVFFGVRARNQRLAAQEAQQGQGGYDDPYANY